MEKGHLGSLGSVSRLTLGGGGLGQLWGKTNRRECVATLRAAVDAEINLIDLAYRYGKGEAELVLGEAFAGKLPDGVRVTSKCLLGNCATSKIESQLRRSIQDSLKRMRLEKLDLFFLHSNVAPKFHPMLQHPDAAIRITAQETFVTVIRPLFECFVTEGLIGAWGLTGIGHPDAIIHLLKDQPPPSAVQCIANPLDSPGSLKFFDDPPRPREIIATAQENDVGVMGIRAVQAGALTDALDRKLPQDHPEICDYKKAFTYRTLARSFGVSAAMLGHRYALSMPGIDTVVLGVKNRAELTECIEAEEAGPLTAEEMALVDNCFNIK